MGAVAVEGFGTVNIRSYFEVEPVGLFDGLDTAVRKKKVE